MNRTSLAGSLLLVFLSINAATADAWKPVSGAESLGHWAIAADPHNSSVLYADKESGNRLWKSTDGGTTWNPTAMNISILITSVIVEPLRPAGVTALYSDDGREYVVRSIDGGITASRRSVGNSLGIASGMAIDAQRPDTLYVSYQPLCLDNCVRFGGIVRSTDGGRNWTAVLKNVTVSDVIADPVTAGIVYAITVSGVLRSLDSGSTWNLTGPNQVGVLLIEPNAGMTLYHVGTTSASRSDDRGETWFPVTNRLPREWEFYYAPFSWSMVKGAVDPTNRSEIVIGAGEAVYRSRNGGATWQTLRDGLEDPYNPGFFTFVRRLVYSVDGNLWAASPVLGLLLLEEDAVTPPLRRRSARH